MVVVVVDDDYEDDEDEEEKDYDVDDDSYLCVLSCNSGNDSCPRFCTMPSSSMQTSPSCRDLTNVASDAIPTPFKFESL